MNTTSTSFRELMDALAAGSEEAAWELTRLYSPHIVRAVRMSLPRVLRTKVDSVDFVQSVWASLLLDPEELLHFEEPQQFIRYLSAIARTKVVDKYRHYSTQRRDVHCEIRASTTSRSCQGRGSDSHQIDLPAAQPTPSQIAVVRERWQAVLQQSSMRDKEIIALRLKGLDYNRIAQSLSINKKTVQRTVHRLVNEFQK